MNTIKEALEQAIEHHKAKRYDQAAGIYEFITARFPDDPQAVYLLGSMYLEIDRHGLAIPLLFRAYELCRQHGIKMSEIPNNLGIALRHIGHDEAALRAYELSLEWNPDNVDALTNLSGLYVNAADPDKCIEICDKCLDKDPGNPIPASHRAIALLERGDYAQGFRQYMSRYKLPSWHQRGYGEHWDGSPVDTLVIHGEQGLGDEILFMSYHDRVKPLAKNIVVECAPRLVPLFARSFKTNCYGCEAEIKEAGIRADAYVPMGSLPVFVGPLPHRHSGYLSADPEMVRHYREELKKLGPGPYVALSWKGGTIKTHMHLRNADYEQWADLVKLPCTFVSAQYGEACKGAKALGLTHFDAVTSDLDEMAALISACDLLISVCNTSIHIAGALNKPCWVLTPRRAAWRYGLKGDSVPWYQSVKLYRQEKDNDWQPVFDAVKRDLKVWCKEAA